MPRISVKGSVTATISGSPPTDVDFNVAQKSECLLVRSDQSGLDQDGDCAGEFTNCIAQISSDPYQMSCPNAVDVNDGWRWARACRNDVTNVTHYDNAVLICAPYIRCPAN